MKHLANVLFRLGASLSDSDANETLDFLAESVTLTRSILADRLHELGRMELIILLNEYGISAAA